MFQNYSQTYAATITTVAGLLGLYLNRFGVTNNDIELAASSAITFIGIVWQLYHRYSKGNVTIMGSRV